MLAMTTAMERLLFAVLILQQWALLEGKVQRGTIKIGGTPGDSDNWQFMSKFGYSYGSSEYFVRYKLPDGTKDTPGFNTVEFNVYLDEDWPKAEKQTGCLERRNHAKKHHEVTFGQNGEWGAWETAFVTQRVRPHIWYFTTSKCWDVFEEIPLYMDYEIMMKQEDGSEFSVEMRGMLTWNVIMLLCLAGFVVYHCSRCKALVNSAGKLHQVHWVLSAAIAFQFAAQSMHTMHLWSYQANGIGIVSADFLSEILFMLSQVVQTTLLIAIAMGYTLLPSKNDGLVVVKWLALLALSIHAALVGFGKMQDESASKYHENEGCIGWVLLSVRLLLFAWFCLATQASQQEGGLRLHDFLRRFRLCGAVYFLTYPVLFVVVQMFAPYLQHPLLQIGLLIMQTGSIVWLAELFMNRNRTYFKLSALSCSLLPDSRNGSFEDLSRASKEN